MKISASARRPSGAKERKALPLELGDAVPSACHGYQLQLLAGAARKTMGAEAPLQKPCALHCGSSADWSALASTKVLSIPKAQNCSPSARRKLKFLPVKDTSCSAIEMQVWVTLSCNAQGEIGRASCRERGERWAVAGVARMRNVGG